jgi:hypothetical protein
VVHPLGETQIQEIHYESHYGRKILERHQPCGSDLDGGSGQLLIVNHFVLQVWNGV